MQALETSIRDYFKDFFTDIKVYFGVVNGQEAIGFDGVRNDKKYSFSTIQVQYDGEMLFHWLENIKGEIVKAEENIVLDKTDVYADLINKTEAEVKEFMKKYY